jgi:hypothetical protein
VNQLQKALYVYGGYEAQADYSYFLAMGAPKQGQTLEQVRDLVLEEVAKLRSGDFDEALLEATVNNIKLSKMRQLEDNASRAQNYVTAFINGIPWKDACKDIDRLAAVTKDDVIAFANEYLGENAYAVVYKRQGEDKTVQKVSAPKITPIVTNRDQASAFLTEIQNSEVKPIEPVFVDFSKDMSQFSLAEGAEVLYKKNELNDVFNLQLVYNKGSQQDPALSLAMSYLSYLGTPDMSAEEMASKMYSLELDPRQRSVREHGRGAAPGGEPGAERRARRGYPGQPEGRHDQGPRRQQEGAAQLLQRPAALPLLRP